MANALYVVAVLGDGEAPDNAMPITLWGAGSGGGGGAATFENVDGELVINGNPTEIGLGEILQQLLDFALSHQQAIGNLDGRVTALENA